MEWIICFYMYIFFLVLLFDGGGVTLKRRGQGRGVRTALSGAGEGQWLSLPDLEACFSGALFASRPGSHSSHLIYPFKACNSVQPCVFCICTRAWLVFTQPMDELHQFRQQPVRGLIGTVGQGREKVDSSSTYEVQRKNEDPNHRSDFSWIEPITLRLNMSPFRKSKSLLLLSFKYNYYFRTSLNPGRQYLERNLLKGWQPSRENSCWIWRK